MPVHTGTNYKFFFCPSCSQQKPLAKRVQTASKFRVRCTDCRDRATKGRGTAGEPMSKGSRGWGNEETADAIPAGIAESYREAVSE